MMHYSAPDGGASLETPEGGDAFALFNRSGRAVVPGEVVRPSTTANKAFEIASAGSSNPLGVAYETTEPGELSWIVKDGLGEVLLEPGTGATRGQLLGLSTTANGRVRAGATTNLIGVALETVSAPAAGLSVPVFAALSFSMAGAAVASPWTLTAGVIRPVDIINPVAVGSNSRSAAANENFFVKDDDEANGTRGIAVELEKNAASVKPGWTGVEVNPIHTGGSNSGNYRGYVANLDFSVAGAFTLSSWTGLKVETAVTNAIATITDTYGVYIESNPGAGTLTNAYGVYIEALDGGTLSYGIYQAGADDLNYFAGAVGVNTIALNATRIGVLDDTEDGTTWGMRATLEKNGAGAKTAWRGFEAHVDHASDADATTYLGFESDIDFVATDTNTLSLAMGFRSQLLVSDGTSTVTDYRAFVADEPGGTGTITDYYGLYIYDTSFGGTLTNAYGVYIGELAGGTLSYGIYQSSVLEENYFAGPIGVNTTSITPSKIAIVDSDETNSTWGIRLLLQKNGAGDKVAWHGVEANADHASDQDGGTYICFDADINFVATDTNTLDAAIGFRSQFLCSDATTTITEYDAFLVDVVAGDAVITDYYGLKVTGPGFVGGTITNAYGVYIGELGGDTKSYSIYQIGKADINYFAGKTGFNELTPEANTWVDITDDIETGSSKGLRVTLDKRSADAKTRFDGVYVNVDWSGSGGGTQVNSFVSDIGITLAAGATIDIARGFYSTCSPSGGTISDYRAFEADGASLGTITDAYGLYIGAMYGDTNSWGIYQAESDDDNWFAGHVAISPGGALAPTEILYVNEDRDGAAGNYTCAIVNNTRAGTDAGYNWTGCEVNILLNSASGGSGDLVHFFADYTSAATSNHTVSSLTLFGGEWGLGNDHTITTAYGVKIARASAPVAGTLVTVYGIYVGRLDVSSTTAYGVYIADQSATTSYGVYQVGTTDINSFAGQIGVGTDTPAANAAIDITSTTRALIVSRMTTAQRDGMAAVNGMIIYNTTTNAFNFRENGSWVTGSGLA